MQTTLLIISSLIIGLAVSGFHLYFELSKQRLIVQERADELLDLAEVGATNAVWTLDSNLAQEIVENVIEKAGLLRVEIRVSLQDEPDEILASFEKPNISASPLSKWVADTYFADISLVRRELVVGEEEPGAQVGTLTLEFSGQYVAQQFLHTAFSYLSISLIEAFLIGLVLLKIVEWLVTTPLRRAAGEIAAVDPGRLEVKSNLIEIPELHQHNELGGLLNHTNQFLGRLAESQTKLRQLATRDSLTGLPNRTLICEYLQTAIASAKRESSLVGVVFLDLDRFKNINDSLGHTVGDRLLKRVATTLSDCIRKDDAVGRLGGDEFLVVIKTAKIEDIMILVKRIANTLTAPNKIEGFELRANASLGIAIYPDDGEDVGTLMQRADLAMYKAKADENALWQLFSASMGAEAENRLVIESSLAGVLDRDELQLYFQPKFSAHDLSMTGCEALLRWRHEEQWVQPAEFIPVAEDMGLICDIGDWVLEETCRFLAKWEKNAQPVSVNVSASQLSDEGFVRRALNTVERYGIDPRLIEFEITETMLMENLSRSRKRLTLLRDRGFSISVDDFGTGYSSLSYLTKLPINALKIDRSFVSGPENSEIILNTVIALGRALDLEIVAEGVETRVQCEMLINSGCDFIQGYYLAKPMPVKQFELQYCELKKIGEV